LILNKVNVVWVSPEDDPAPQEEDSADGASVGFLRERLRSS
jgi:hypothetical protein